MKFAYDIHTLYFPTVYDSHLTIGHGHSILSKIKKGCGGIYPNSK